MLFSNKNGREYQFIGFDKPAWWSNTKDLVWEVTKILFISLAIIIPIRYFLIQPFYVKGASMEPNFFDKEYLIIDEISYRFRDVARGDIVVFRYPEDTSQFFIKRVVALPGERVVIENGVVTIFNQDDPDGFVLDEGYVADGIETIVPSGGFYNVTLGANEFYVLGDNRLSSLDSRKFGPLSQEFVIGRAWVRGWPINRISIIESPQYPEM